MLRLISVLAIAPALVLGENPPCDEEFESLGISKVFTDQDDTDGSYDLRLKFRSSTSDAVPTGSVHASGAVPTGASTGTVGFIGASKDCDGSKTMGASCAYNASTGITTLKKIGGYTLDDAGVTTLEGPGTVYVTHLDIEPFSDSLSFLDAKDDNVILTGNYSACIRMHDLDGSFGDFDHTADTYGLTEHQMHNADNTPGFDAGNRLDAPADYSGNNDFCHDVLTGKVLGPAPVELKQGSTTVTFTVVSAESRTNDGFTLQYVTDDWYYLDLTDSGSTYTFSNGVHTCDINDVDALIGGTTAPGIAAPAAHFVDTDMNAQKIQGTLHITNLDSGESVEVTLQKVMAAGKWGFMSGLVPDNTDDPDVKKSNGRDGGARSFYKHGDVIPASHRGELEDLREGQEVIDVKTFIGVADAPTVTIEDSGSAISLDRSKGSPPSPMYRFKVQRCVGSICNSRNPTYIRVMDVSSKKPTLKFFGDLEPETRHVMGSVTVVPPTHALGLLGYRMRWRSTTGPGEIIDDGSNDEGGVNLVSTCGDNPSDTCGNSSPFSPTCSGKSCPFINILPGSGGEFYISRVDGNLDAIDTSTGTNDNTDAAGNARPYGNNEKATVSLPYAGWLTVASMDVQPSSSGDSCVLSSGVDLTDGTAAAILGANIDVEPADTVSWTTGKANPAAEINPSQTARGSTGFTLVYQPNYPQLIFQKVAMEHGMSGLDAKAVFGRQDSSPFVISTIFALDAADASGFNFQIEQTGDDLAYVETVDWIVPNTTCTPTTMHCPVPSTWAHINYTTPSLYPEPAEGSCLQQKSGQSSLYGCGLDQDSAVYAGSDSAVTGKDADYGSAGGKGVGGNWAGNCGTAKSYFWFEKIACGSEREFHTLRSLIIDTVTLTPNHEDIATILAVYYTTKAPEHGGGVDAVGGGITWTTDTYHIAPVLPPQVKCECTAAIDAYTSLLSVVSETPAPGAPVTLDPEILNSDNSGKMIATLRAYNDPTYSMPAGTGVIPVVVTRFYLEVATKFTRNRITIKGCTAAASAADMDSTPPAVLSPLGGPLDFCPADPDPFEVLSEGAPAGVTHLDRISMRKFKFGSSSDVVMKCEIRACAQQPCGTCDNSRRLSTDNSRKLQGGVDLAPVNGDMSTPTISLSLSRFDNNALVFPTPTGSTVQQPASQNAAVQPAQQQQPTSAPIQIQSEMTLPMTPTWAIANRDALTSTLRATLGLVAGEDLVITRISAARARQLSAAEAGRKLQQNAGSVKVDFVVGVSSNDRAVVANQGLTSLTSGNPTVLAGFAAQLDQDLQSRGAAPVALNPAQVRFSPPMSAQNVASVGGAATQGQVWTPQYNVAGQQQTAQETASSEEKSDSTLYIILGGIAFALLLIVIGLRLGCSIVVRNDEHGSHMGVVFSKKGSAPAAQQQQQQPAQNQDTTYQGKVNPAEYDNIFAQ